MSKKKISFKLPASKKEPVAAPEVDDMEKIDKWVSSTSDGEKSKPTVQKKEQKKSRLSVDIDEVDFRDFKKRCIEEGVSMSSKVQSMIRNCLG